MHVDVPRMAVSTPLLTSAYVARRKSLHLANVLQVDLETEEGGVEGHGVVAEPQEGAEEDGEHHEAEGEEERREE